MGVTGIDSLPGRSGFQQRFTDAVHIVSQSKGGVGKSLVAKCLAEFCVSEGRQPRCFDADPANQTFAEIKALGVTVLDLIEDDEIKRRILTIWWKRSPEIRGRL